MVHIVSHSARRLHTTALAWKNARRPTITCNAPYQGIVSVSESRRFVIDVMKAVGVCEDNAVAIAAVLIAADHRGHFSHGLNRLDMYVEDVQRGVCLPNAQPVIIKETAATAWVDGKNSLGVVVGNFCMKQAIQKAKTSGVGWVVANSSNHYGIASWYSSQALAEGFLGMSFSNTSPLMCPTGGKKAALGTNPLTLAAPGENGDNFLLDMATTTVAVGKIEFQRRKREPIPDGWALGPDGKPTTDAEVGFKTKCLLPLGGTAVNSGFKGFGLGVLVEVFCGILGGASFGPNVRGWMDETIATANLGQCFVAIDPSCFAPGFQSRMSSLMDHLRAMEPADPSTRVMVAGDPELNNIKKVDKQGGIQYHPNQLKASAELAASLGVDPMKVS